MPHLDLTCRVKEGTGHAPRSSKYAVQKQRQNKVSTHIHIRASCHNEHHRSDKAIQGCKMHVITPVIPCWCYTMAGDGFAHRSQK